MEALGAILDTSAVPLDRVSWIFEDDNIRKDLLECGSEDFGIVADNCLKDASEHSEALL